MIVNEIWNIMICLQWPWNHSSQNDFARRNFQNIFAHSILLTSKKFLPKASHPIDRPQKFKHSALRIYVYKYHSTTLAASVAPYTVFYTLEWIRLSWCEKYDFVCTALCLRVRLVHSIFSCRLIVFQLYYTKQKHTKKISCDVFWKWFFE